MQRLSISIIMLAIAGLAVAAYAVNGHVLADRPDCPGKVVCPLTGDLVCKDRCPAGDTDRPDCPGQIICPQTGELVCRDRCPLNKAEQTAAQDAPSCCRSKK